VNSKCEFASVFRYIDKFNTYSFGANFAKNVVYFNKIVQGKITNIVMKKHKLTVKTWYVLHVEMVKNSFKFQLFEEGQRYFKQG